MINKGLSIFEEKKMVGEALQGDVHAYGDSITIQILNLLKRSGTYLEG